MIGEGSYQPYAINTFSGKGRLLLTPIHYVHPHSVSSYVKRDGTVVSGYWRDGDGDTSRNRATGYYARNPNAVSMIVKKVGWL